MYYGDKRASVVEIAHTIMNQGWEIYGYHPDESDSMTDYYSPAYWNGIATKNGCVLCVDVGPWRANDSGKTVYKTDDSPLELTVKTTEKLQQLQTLAEDKGATEGEKQAALAAIDRIKTSAAQRESERIVNRQVVEQWPEFQINPPRTNWHVEKNGKIIDKGNGAFQFSHLRYGGDEKEHAKFQKLIDRIEKAAAVKIGNGTEDEYTTITETKYRKENKPVKTDTGELKAGQSFILTAYFRYGCIKGSVYQIERITEYGIVYAYKWNRKYTKVCTGNTRGNSFIVSLKTFKEYLKESAVTYCEIQEQQTPYEVEKCVKVNRQPEEAKTENDGITYTVKKDKDTRDDSDIWVVKVNEKLTREQFQEVRGHMKELGGYYSKFKHGFLFKFDPSQKLHASGVESKEQEEHETDRTITHINKRIESAKKTIGRYSGEYKANTYKRMQEQASRDKKIEAAQEDMQIMEYLLQTIKQRKLTPLESGIVSKAFHEYIASCWNRYSAIEEGTAGSAVVAPSFPEIDEQSAEWYRTEIEKQIKRLKQNGIQNTEELTEAIKEYGRILEQIPGTTEEYHKQKQIKELVNKAKLQQKGDINFTPAEICETLVDLADITQESKVLEPSAGIGSIADAVVKITDTIDVIERMGSFREILELKGHNVVWDDFLTYQPLHKYDAIIMNPPFSDEQRHIQHAYTMLEEGGRLVAITSPHWTFAKDKNSFNFRNWLDEEQYYTKELGNGTFEMTNVASKILVIEKRKNERIREA